MGTNYHSDRMGNNNVEKSDKSPTWNQSIMPEPTGYRSRRCMNSSKSTGTREARCGCGGGVAAEDVVDDRLDGVDEELGVRVKEGGRCGVGG